MNRGKNGESTEKVMKKYEKMEFFMVFHGSGWVLMVLHGSRLVFHGSWSVFMVSDWFSWFFMVPGRFFMVFHGSG